ncbi:MAG: GDP-mannose 4,6-dehydratase [Anaerolineae bacterium]|nr:GDP-mannose 4,6-dehydratase [Anaerolineae bacterium]
MKTSPVTLITGAAGLCAHHLINLLSALGYHIFGFDQKPMSDPNIEAFTGDIVDILQVKAVLNQTKPKYIFHLAAHTDPSLSYEELHHVNVLGTLRLLNAAREACPQSTIVITSSSAAYGRVPPEALPITENHPFAPITPYAVSKVTQEMVAYEQFAQHDLHIVRTRAFNLIGPGETTHFVTSAFARQIAEIEADLREPTLRVGNLDAVRDFTDVRDAVLAYHLLAKQGKAGEVYNVCSGQGTAIRDLLDILLDLSTRRDIAIQVDPARLQPSDVPIQIGDASKLHDLTGWTPAIPLRQTLEDVLNYWRIQTTRH